MHVLLLAEPTSTLSLLLFLRVNVCTRYTIGQTLYR